MSLEVCYLEQSGKSDDDLLRFLAQARGRRAAEHFVRQRMPWYQSTGGFRVAVAVLDGQIVGCNCAHKTTAVVRGQRAEWWWSTDAFVLPEARGRGIGKKMQALLHADCPNVASAWYSPTTGHVKRSVGSRPVATVRFSFYAVSLFFTLYLRLALLKILKRDIRRMARLPYLYAALQGAPARRYALRPVDPDMGQVADFAHRCLAGRHDFYVERSARYLTWKYPSNPSLAYQWAEVVDSRGQRQALMAFTPPRDMVCVMATVRAANLLDCFIDPASRLTQKDALRLLARHFRRQGQPLDGIRSLIDCPWRPALRYPLRGSALLSSFAGEPFRRPYLTYIDHDMEQM